MFSKDSENCVSGSKCMQNYRGRISEISSNKIFKICNNILVKAILERSTTFSSEQLFTINALQFLRDFFSPRIVLHSATLAAESHQTQFYCKKNFDEISSVLQRSWLENHLPALKDILTVAQ